MAAAALEQNLKPKKRENRVGSDDNLKGGKRKSLKVSCDCKIFSVRQFANWLIC